VGDRSKQLEQQMIALRAQHEVLVRIRKNLAGEANSAAPASEAPPPASPQLASANDAQAGAAVAPSAQPEKAA
jgi:hypothetical protein